LSFVSIPANVTAKLDLQGKELKKDNQKYMDVEGFKFTFEPTGMKIRLDNLFNGNKQLSKFTFYVTRNFLELLSKMFKKFVLLFLLHLFRCSLIART
jgi:hypothetical protein